MSPRTLLAALSTLAALPALGQEAAPAAAPPRRHVTVDVSLVPGLSINGEGPVLNNLSLGLVAHSTELRGVALAAAHLADGDVTGLQWTWAASSAGGTVRGVQLASFANVAGDLRGLQWGGVNVTRRGVEGVQLAVVNVGGEVAGSQIGLVNVARKVHGLQLGVVNVAREADGSVGALALVGDGRHQAELFATELTPLAAGVRLGGRRAYGVLTGGVQPEQRPSGRTLWTTGGGGGVGFQPTARLSLDLDLTGQCLWLDDTAEGVVGSLRATAGWRFTPWLAAFAGPTANVVISDEAQPDVDLGTQFGEGTGRYQRYWFGFVAGLRVF
ncbi:MAG: hypothetical protein QM767_19815 [Anaeromyxobacter sp.]